MHHRPVLPRLLGFFIALVLLGALVAAAPAGAGGAYTESGRVSSTDASYPRSQTFEFAVSGPTRISAELRWTDDERADLSLQIKNAGGATVAETNGKGSNPEKVKYDTPANAGGNWKIVVFAVNGTATFDVEWHVDAVVPITTTTRPPATTTTTTTPTTPPPPPPSGTNYLRPFASQNIGNKSSYTQAEADEAARHFARIIAGPAAFKGKVAGMHAVNRNLKVLAYVNAAFVGKSQGPASGQFPTAWYMRDANGNGIQSMYGNWMMDISNPDWVNNRKSVCKNTATNSGYDGCSLDMLGTAPLDAGYTSSKPINPATGQVWTPAEYYDATTRLARAASDFAAPMTVDGNGMRNGLGYFDPAASAKVLFGGVEQAIAEAFVRPGSAGITSYRTEASWRKDVDMLAHVDATGNAVGAMTKAWVAGTQEQKDALHAYSLATFLLGTGGRSTFYFSYVEASDAAFVHPWWKTNVGSPAGAYANYQKVGGVYIRTFSNAVVIANPTTAAGTITLPAGNWRDINGGTVRSGTVSVPVHAGWVMVPA